MSASGGLPGLGSRCGSLFGRRDDARGKSEDVGRLLAAIEANICDPAFDVNKLKRICLPSKAMLWCFRGETGRTLKAYLDERRAVLARSLVCESDAKLRQIAERLGFLDAELFSKWFKRQWGKPPTLLRLEQPAVRSTLSDASPADGKSPRRRDWRQAFLGALEHEEAVRLYRQLRAKRASLATSTTTHPVNLTDQEI